MSEAFERILVPVDLTPASRRSLDFALALGQLFGSVVDALHVWRTNTQTAVTVARDHAKQALRDFVADVRIPERCELRRRTDYGDPYLTILRLAQLSGFDLIVSLAPAPGRARPEHVSLALLHTSRVPVLLVPGGWAPGVSELDLTRSVRRIVVPSMLAARSGRPLALAQRLREATGAELELLDGDVDAVLRRAAGHDDELWVAGVDGSSLGGAERDVRAERVLLAQSCPVLCVHHG